MGPIGITILQPLAEGGGQEVAGEGVQSRIGDLELERLGQHEQAVERGGRERAETLFVQFREAALELGA